MNTDRNDYSDFIEEEYHVSIQQIIGKYIRYWPWFFASILITISAAFFYLRYADVIYNTEAKVRLISEKDNSNFSLDLSKIMSKSNINLENEIALFKSVHLSEEVVKDLNFY